MECCRLWLNHFLFFMQIDPFGPNSLGRPICLIWNNLRELLFDSPLNIFLKFRKIIRFPRQIPASIALNNRTNRHWISISRCYGV